MTCPLKFLPCVPGTPEFDEFDDKCTDEPYFFLGDTLDYFSFFLKPGKHEPSDRFRKDPEDMSCDWKKNNRTEPWPMTRIDCTLGLDNVEKEKEDALAAAITNFHKPDYSPPDVFLCALNILGGRGGVEHGVCDLIKPQECQSKPGHKFGAVFDTKDLHLNVLEGAPCTQSSTWSNAVCTRGNDGNTDPAYWHYSVFHTRNQANPSWTAVFFETTKVSKIIVYNRDDGYRIRSDKIVVTLLDAKGTPVWTSPPVQPSFLVQEFLIPSVQANSIRVLNPLSYASLHLAEVEVYGAEVETSLPLEDGDEVYLQNNALDNQWMSGGRGHGNYAVRTRDHLGDAYERSLGPYYQWTIRSQANDFLPGGAPCIRYGDVVRFQVAPTELANRWLRGTDTVESRTFDPNDNSFTWILRSTTESEDSLFGKCVLDKSPVYIQERKSHNYLLGAMGNNDTPVYARKYDALLAEKYQWLIRFNSGRGQTRFVEGGQSLS